MPISQFILDAPEQKRLQLRLRNKWMIRIRWYYVLILTAAIVGPTLLTNTHRQAIVGYVMTTIVALFCNGLLWLATLPTYSRIIYFQIIAFCQILLELTLASWIVYSQGGLASRTTVLYAIPILITGVLFRGWYAYVAAIFSAIAYGTALTAVYFVGNTELPLMDITVPIIFYASVFMVLAAVVSRVTDTIALNEREQSYNELLSLLRHELHHPISVMSALVEMLENSQSYSKFSPQERRFLKQLRHENQRLYSMIAKLLEAGEQSKDAQMSSVNIISVVNDSAVDCATAAKRLNDLDARFNGQALMVTGNAEQLRLVFDNIIENAFRYSDEGTKVSLSVHETKTAAEITVTDHGEGIAGPKQKHLFKRFTYFEHDNEEHKADAIYSLGLGLYVSKLIIERHGGEIAIHSEPQQGTNVTIKLKKGTQ
jgi:signal transduction histidine kinase